MSNLKRAQFQEAAVEHIVARLRDKDGSRRMLLADEVGLGKTVVARGVIERLLERRRKPLTVIYLCSNAEIAEQNRTKLDPKSRKPIGRVTELALERHTGDGQLFLYSFTPGTSLKEGTGLAWERRLLLYLLHRIYGFKVWTKDWREFFRCGAGEDRWHGDTSRNALFEEFERKTGVAFQTELAAAWRVADSGGQRAVTLVRELVPWFDATDKDARTRRNHLVALLRGVMQRVALRHLEPDLVVLDEVQRFRDVLEEAENPSHIAAELFGRRVPVLILSATPYRALTLGHEVSEGGPSHYDDFIKTLEFLFDKDRVTPDRIRRNLEEFGKRLRKPDLAERLDPTLLAFKRQLEEDLTKVICRTERNWYVLDRRKGIEDAVGNSEALPGKEELEEFFRLHQGLPAWAGTAQVTEFWKSAPSLLTFLDGNYQLLKKLRDANVKVPRKLLTSAKDVSSLSARNHRIARVVDVALGPDGEAPRLWTAPTYTYYQDDFFGRSRPRKLLVFSGWRFVPKTVAIIASRVAENRLGGQEENPTQPLRFSERRSFHAFDVCFPSPALAEVGEAAHLECLAGEASKAGEVVEVAVRLLRSRLKVAGIQVVSKAGDPIWQVVMRLERKEGRAAAMRESLEAWVQNEGDGNASDPVLQHKDWAAEWLSEDRPRLELSEVRLRHLALVAAFSPANCVLRALRSVYGDDEAKQSLRVVMSLCLGPMRRYFNRPHVQQIIRQHRFRMQWRQMSGESEPGFAERTLVYCGDAHLQAVLDEYVHLQRHAGQGDSVEKAVSQLSDVWTLSRGSPRTNGAKGYGDKVSIKLEAETHATHFALAFGEDVSKDTGPDADEDKLRKSVVREAFNSPFWPFVLATTSVGQEGLDFHLYCRDILHWNLPSNPVDLEQREGRINRRDCLAVRESIARDWPLTRPEMSVERRGARRNPWSTVFDRIGEHDDLQKYKHGLYPHWVYECLDPNHTVRIQRHVPFFSTSRDAAKYERLKAGLALYRLVFGQANQEDLLDNLQQQLERRDPTAQDRALRRLSSYMLNLSPIGHRQALLHADGEAKTILAGLPDDRELEKLLAAVDRILVDSAEALRDVRVEVEGLLQVARRNAGISAPPRALHAAVAALAYLRNPYDHIFDQHVEGGFADDMTVIRDAWATVNKSKKEAAR